MLLASYLICVLHTVMIRNDVDVIEVVNFKVGETNVNGN